MKKMIRGTAAFLVMYGLGACFDDPTAGINNANYHIVQPVPATAWVDKSGDSVQLFVRFVNDADNGAVTSYNIVNPNPAAVKVNLTLNYRQIYQYPSDTLVNTTDKDQQQYFIVGTAPGEYTFKIVPTINTADTGSVLVRVAPSIVGAWSKNPANLGDTLTFVAPQYARFTPTSVIHLTNSAGIVINTVDSLPTIITTAVQRVSDSTTLKILMAHGAAGYASISNVKVTFPDISLVLTTLRTSDSLAFLP